MNIIIQHNSSENHPWQQGFEYVKAELEKEFPEAFDIVIHPNGALANRDWKVELEQTQTNVIQMMCESSIPFATLQSELFALNTPFLFDDMEHYLRYMNTRPEVVYKWFDLLEEKNVQVIAVWPRPPRQLLNSAREIRTPDDIKGLKFRVPGLDLFIQTFEAMGAKPVPMSASEIYTAMQLGTVVGEDNAIGTVFDFTSSFTLKSCGILTCIVSNLLLNSLIDVSGIITSRKYFASTILTVSTSFRTNNTFYKFIVIWIS